MYATRSVGCKPVANRSQNSQLRLKTGCEPIATGSVVLRNNTGMKGNRGGDDERNDNNENNKRKKKKSKKVGGRRKMAAQEETVAYAEEARTAMGEAEEKEAALPCQTMGEAAETEARPPEEQQQQEDVTAAPVDERILWLKRRVCAGLDIPDSLFLSFLLDQPLLISDFLDGLSLCLLLYVSTDHGSLQLQAFTTSTSHPSPVRSMYFMKLKAGNLVSIEDMETFLEFGVLPIGPSFESLEQLLYHLFLPLLAQEDVYDSKFWAMKQTCIVDKIGNELQSNMNRFLFQVSSAKQLLSLGTKLVIPSLPADCLGKLEVDYDLLLELETAANDWLPVIEAAIHCEALKVPVGKSPLVELEFWQERVNALSGLYEQLTSQRLRNIISILEVGSSNIELLQSFKSQSTDLTKMFLEAKDNVKFLTTLERHFKAICKERMERVLEAISPMMNALRMVWVLSRYYSDDSHMGALMERISFQIAQRVSEDINLKVLYKLPALEASQKISIAKSVLDSWCEVYLQVREQIELSGRDPRWEFDRKRLFERTTYMSSICADLLNMVEVVNDFRNFLGPQLKAVTGDIDGIDSVIQKVMLMVENVEKLPFNVFDKSYALQWSATMSNFNMDKENIEHLTKSFIDTSFKKLRSAEGALDLLQNFKSIKSEGAINKQMMEKFNDIIAQFLKEIETTREIFEKHSTAPPTTRNQPPIAGSINWARCLFGRLKKTMQKFKTVGSDMMRDPPAQEMSIYYAALGKQMLSFEKQMVEQWSQSVSQQASHYLKQPILYKDPEGKILVNFDKNLHSIIRETKYLDAMGFQLPEIALNVTLQEEKFRLYIDNIHMMLQHYYKTVEILAPIEAKLLAFHVKKLQEVLGPGFSYLNWNSLGIPDFVSTCMKAINEFKSLVNQVSSS